METEAKTEAAKQVLLQLSQQTIYLMGASFILGSMFTLFLLLTLDFIREHKKK